MQKKEGITDRAVDLLRDSEYEVKVSKFLTPQERILVHDTLCAAAGKAAERCFFWGGCRGTERCAAVFLPEWAIPEDFPQNLRGDERETAFASLLAEPDNPIVSEIPISAVRITGSGFKALSHRDFMGSVLSLGIERNMVGDILVVSEREALVFVLNGVRDLILTELTKIGRDGVKCSLADISPEYKAERAFETIVVTVQSMRLDGVVNQLTGDGRSAASEYIIKGLVDHNYFTATNVSAEVHPGDILSIRGYGKFVIGETDGTTRSGRLRLHCKKYK